MDKRRIPKRIRKTLEQIRKYCGKHTDCDKCPLHELCTEIFAGPPEDWIIEEDRSNV